MEMGDGVCFDESHDNCRKPRLLFSMKYLENVSHGDGFYLYRFQIEVCHRDDGDGLRCLIVLTSTICTLFFCFAVFEEFETEIHDYRRGRLDDED